MEEIVVKDVLKKGYKKKRINFLLRVGIVVCLRKIINEDDWIFGEFENFDENLNEIMWVFCFLFLLYLIGFFVYINGYFVFDFNWINIWIED